ncbi:MAG: hypothetical protein J6N51_16800 [Selenomonas sp.]|nr:hypothetical protein [Selenomonas sp.]
MTAYALLAGFAVVVGLGIYNGGILDTFKRAYMNMGQQLAEGAKDARDFRYMSVAQLKEIDNGARVAADQAALKNLGARFLGLTRSELQAIQKNGGSSYTTLDKGSFVCDYNIKDTGNEEGHSAKVYFDARVAVDSLINWLGGDYHHDVAPKSTEKATREGLYFYSDGVLDYEQVSTGYTKANVSLRNAFTFKNGKVESVRVWLTRAYQGADGNWSVELCEGLDVVVTNQ